MITVTLACLYYPVSLQLLCIVSIKSMLVLFYKPKNIYFYSLFAFVIAENQERFYLYLIISVAAGILLCLILLVARLLVQRHRARREAKFHATNVADHSLPNGFADDISEVDADIDLTTPLPVPSVAVHAPVPVGSIAEVVRYPHGHTHTLRRMPESDTPRSLSTPSNSHYYYG